ncbi:MAG: HEAT repeat domain-containing protein [Planctomycetota bacterium]|nr:HEAT repeat domain-containing protein [Planctomycetota bacterium]
MRSSSHAILAGFLVTLFWLPSFATALAGEQAADPQAQPSLDERLRQPITVDFLKADMNWVVNTLFVLTGVNVMADEDAMRGRTVALHAADLPVRQVLEFMTREGSGLQLIERENCIWIVEQEPSRHARVAVPALIEALADKEDEVRKQAVEALGEIGAPAIAKLVEALKHKDKAIRAGAAQALGRIAKP